MWIWWMRHNFTTQFLQLLKCWLCDVQSDIVVEKNRALSVHQCQLQSLQFLVHPTDLLSTLLRCNGFSGIQKAVVDQSGSRPPKSNHNFFGISLGLGSALELLLDPTTELVYCWLSYTIRFSLHVTIWSRNGLLMLCSCCIK